MRRPLRFGICPSANTSLHSTRWATGEVDMVSLDPSTQKPHWCVEVKWTDRPAKDVKQLRHVVAFAKEHHFANSIRGRHPAMVTTKTVHELRVIEDVPVAFVPTSLYAYVLGKNLLSRLHNAKKTEPKSPAPSNE